jgi:hypothetical protein
MAGYATEDYYTENFGSPPARIADRLQKELDRASRYVRAECPDLDARIVAFILDPTAPGAIDPDIAADVVCEMVTSAASSPGGVGIGSIQQGAGPYQETLTFSNPVGDLYLSKKQKRLLGCGGQQAFTLNMAPDPIPRLRWYDGWETL